MIARLNIENPNIDGEVVGRGEQLNYELLLSTIYKGQDGKSAYEIAVDHGFVGSEEEWLASNRMVYKVVETLPEVGESNVFYLKKNALGAYEQYVYYNGAYECVGTSDIELDNYYTKPQTYSRAEVDVRLQEKVDKVDGKQLSTNDYSDDEQAKLQGIEAEAQKNVQADWEEANEASDGYIKNKPILFSGNYNDLLNAPDLDGFVVKDASGKVEASALPEATELKKGVMRLATEAEARAGVRGDVALSPAVVKQILKGATVEEIYKTDDETYAYRLSANSSIDEARHVYAQKHYEECAVALNERVNVASGATTVVLVDLLGDVRTGYIENGGVGVVNRKERASVELRMTVGGIGLYSVTIENAVGSVLATFTNENFTETASGELACVATIPFINVDTSELPFRVRFTNNESEPKTVDLRCESIGVTTFMYDVYADVVFGNVALVRDGLVIEGSTLSNMQIKIDASGVVSVLGSVRLGVSDERLTTQNKDVVDAINELVGKVADTLQEANDYTNEKVWEIEENVYTKSEVDEVVSVKADATALATKAEASVVEAHIADKANPHEVTKAQVGLGAVDNTSDADKPVSTATQEALTNVLNQSNAYTDSKRYEVQKGTQDTLGIVRGGKNTRIDAEGCVNVDYLVCNDLDADVSDGRLNDKRFSVRPDANIADLTHTYADVVTPQSRIETATGQLNTTMLTDGGRSVYNYNMVAGTNVMAYIFEQSLSEYNRLKQNEYSDYTYSSRCYYDLAPFPYTSGRLELTLTFANGVGYDVALALVGKNGSTLATFTRQSSTVYRAEISSGFDLTEVAPCVVRITAGAIDRNSFQGCVLSMNAYANEGGQTVTNPQALRHARYEFNKQINYTTGYDDYTRNVALTHDGLVLQARNGSLQARISDDGELVTNIATTADLASVGGTKKVTLASASIVTLQPNTRTVITNAVSSLSVYFANGTMPADVVREYSLVILAGGNTSVSFGTSITWAGGNAPVWVSGKRYEINICDGLGLFTEF